MPETKMKICYIASPIVHTKRWMKYFADNGHEVHLMVPSLNPSDPAFFGPSDTGIGNVEIHVPRRIASRKRIINYLLNSVPLILQFRRLIRDVKPDIVHAHSVSDTSLLGAFSGFHPFIVTAWGSEVLNAPKRSRISKWLAKYVLKKADWITCDAEHIQEPLVQLGANRHKIRLIRFGTDVEEFSPSKRDEQLRHELGIRDSPAIVSSRHLFPIYDVETLILAIPQVLKEVPEAKFIIVGKGSQEKKLKKLAFSLGVRDSVRFIGWVPSDELPRYIASADIYVSTSLSDAGLASSTAEAMASGLPVVITDFGDNKRWVEDGVNGFTFPLRSPEVLASKLNYLLNHWDERKQFGQTNRQLICERNNWRTEMDRMGRLYEESIVRYRKTKR